MKGFLMEIKEIHYTKDITSFQFRGIRYALGLKIQALTEAINISSRTLGKIENPKNGVYPEKVDLTTITRLRHFYETKGVTFLEQNGTLYDPDAEKDLLTILNKNLNSHEEK